LGYCTGLAGAAGFILWGGMLQAHMVMKHFLKHNFKWDLELNAILVQLRDQRPGRDQH
jgi:hypothetical protein